MQGGFLSKPDGRIPKVVVFKTRKGPIFLKNTEMFLFGSIFPIVIFQISTDNGKICVWFFIVWLRYIGI